MEEIIITKSKHERRDVFCIEYNPCPKFDDVCEIMDCTRDRHNSYWTLANSKENLKLIYTSFRGIAYVNARAVFDKSRTKKISKARMKTESYPIPPAYKAMLIRGGYSKKIYLSYTTVFQKYLNFLKGHDLDTITDKEITEYVTTNMESISAQNQAIIAIKFYFENVRIATR